MIQIENRIWKKQENFWSHCHFHPTDAIEDAWGKRILDQMSADQSVRSVRMYTMFEDIVYRDEYNQLCFDFRLNDLRLEYMLQCGFDIVLCYNFMPECIAKNQKELSCVSKNKTRYKGKLINTSVPADYKDWEEVCYVYTAHILEKFGIETVSQWRIQCFNEPDIPEFFMSDLPREDVITRTREYCKLYHHFEKGIRRASDRLHIGGPVLASSTIFLEGFFEYVRENGLKLDFISLHNYGTAPSILEDGTKPLNVKNNLEKQAVYYEIIKKYGFENKEILLDEWGAASGGFQNRERFPSLMFRETEVFSAYYAKLIAAYIDSGLPVSRMLLCLSGQHEMTEDFSGFRNFFTMHFIAKPIYNAFRMASRLKENLLAFRSDSPEVSVIATKDDGGNYACMLCYASETFEESLPDITQEICFPEALCGKHLQVYCIDRNTTNPYRLYQSQHMSPELTEEEISRLREEGQLKPVMDCPIFQKASLNLTMTANSVFLITAENP